MRRSFSSFTQAAQENGVSRILIGFHFRKAVEEALSMAKRLAIAPSTFSYDLCSDYASRPA